MAIETLNISGWDSGWPLGFISNADEAVVDADGSAVATNFASDVVIFDLDNVTTIDALDVVTAVDITVRCNASNISHVPYLRVELLIGGISRGFDLTSTLNQVYVNEFLSNGNWDQNWTVAQLNSAQVRVTSDAVGGGSGPTEWRIDCIDVVVTYTAIDPITREPAEATLALTGEAPLRDVSEDSPVEDPAEYPATLNGKVPVLDTGIPVVAAGDLELIGNPSYIDTQLLQLQINGWDAGWPYGFVSNVDEPSANADGSTVGTPFVSDTVVFDLDNVTGIIDDLDTVLSVTMVVRAYSLWIVQPPEPGFPARISVELLVNGSSYGGVSQQLTNTTPQNFSLSVAGWNQDWSEAQLNSMQVRVRTTFGDFIEALIDTIDVVVEYIPQSPILARIDEGSLSLTGKVPDTLINSIEVPTDGALALAGTTSVVLERDVELPPQALLRFTKTTPTLLINHIGQPAAYTMALNEQTPLRISNNPEDPGAGSMALSGKVPTFDFTYVREIAATSITLNGRQVLKLTAGLISVENGQVVLAGDAPEPSLSDNRRYLPPSSPMVLAGSAPALSYGRPVAPTAGTLSLAGVVSTLSYGSYIVPPAGSLTFTGFAPTDYLGPATLILAGTTPGIATVNAPVIPLGTLALTGRLPYYEHGTKLVDQAVLTFNRTAPTLVFSSGLVGKPGIISLTVDRDIEIIATPTDIVVT